jgi:cellulose synthase/poly-beta-1,6-N-acetylglucosamine synthase-like glycosyltransferase
MIDADSQIQKDGLIKLAEPFVDERIGATSGIIRASINGNPLVWYQDMEYMLSSMWRYVFDKMGCAYILPGFCAMRRTLFYKAGGFETDTLSEDFDIGLKIRKAGYGIMMTKAVMNTKPPQTLSGIAKQRIRWGWGTLQVIKKHSDVIFNPKYGLIGIYGIPNQLYFYLQGFVILPLILYQMFNGYMTYFVIYGNYITPAAIKYFVFWMSVFGTIELSINIVRGIWEMHWTFPYFIVSYVLTYFYHFLAAWRVRGLNMKTVMVLCFFFPYYLFTLVFFIYPMILELNPWKKKQKHINIWEKNK